MSTHQGNHKVDNEGEEAIPSRARLGSKTDGGRKRDHGGPEQRGARSSCPNEVTPQHDSKSPPEERWRRELKNASVPDSFTSLPPFDIEEACEWQ
ncbi:unnamed protein product [Protopolystoma xenopodis]|uniref:Uncharacterized protein n=1 Tax=Protopolystoma xenopodis TaxID=117903 RepID=A0A448WH58_9PLAT|nr:unnamed protein product [Protopolystoma xenopodis]